MNSERLFTLVAQIQAEVGQRPSGNGSLTLHFQNGRVQAVEMTTHTRVTAALLDSPPLKR